MKVDIFLNNNKNSFFHIRYIYEKTNNTRIHKQSQNSPWR